MAEYRDRTTGEIKSQGQLRKENPNMSMPKVWNENVLEALNVDPVYKTNPPTTDVGPYQMLQLSGVEQNTSGDWALRTTDRYHRLRVSVNGNFTNMLGVDVEAKPEGKR